MGKTRILIAENESIIAQDLQQRLQNWGYEVIAVVSSGKEAIQKVEENNPSIVLLNIGLNGEIDGIEAATEIHSLFRVPIVYLTGYADERTKKRARIAEPYGYIIKPFEDRELHTAVEMALLKAELVRP